MTPRWLSCQWFCLSVSSRLLIAPPSCISIQGFCLSVSSGNLITPPSCLSLQEYSLFVSSRFLIAPPCCLLLQGYCLSVCLLAVSQPLLFHFNNMSYHLDGAICMCPVQRYVISEPTPLSLITPHASLLSPSCLLGRVHTN